MEPRVKPGLKLLVDKFVIVVVPFKVVGPLKVAGAFTVNWSSTVRFKAVR